MVQKMSIVSGTSCLSRRRHFKPFFTGGLASKPHFLCVCWVRRCRALLICRLWSIPHRTGRGQRHSLPSKGQPSWGSGPATYWHWRQSRGEGGIVGAWMEWLCRSGLVESGEWRHSCQSIAHSWWWPGQHCSSVWSRPALSHCRVKEGLLKKVNINQNAKEDDWKMNSPRFLRSMTGAPIFSSSLCAGNPLTFWLLRNF